LLFIKTVHFLIRFSPFVQTVIYSITCISATPLRGTNSQFWKLLKMICKTICFCQGGNIIFHLIHIILVNKVYIFICQDCQLSIAQAARDFLHRGRLWVKISPSRMGKGIFDLNWGILWNGSISQHIEKTRLIWNGSNFIAYGAY